MNTPAGADQADGLVVETAKANPDGLTQNSAVPVRTKDRIETLDFIRGIAVMGILAANIVVFGQPFNAYTYPGAWIGETGDPDGWLWIAQFVMIDGKMRGLFTLLFGAGMYLFMERAWARGATAKLQAWRLLMLFLFGYTHFVFLWMGDILAMYALIGLLALTCIGWKAKTQLTVGLVGYGLGAMVYALFSFPYFVTNTALGEADGMDEMRVELAKAIEEALADDKVISAFKVSGDYWGLVQHRLSEDWYFPLLNSSIFFLETLPLMLLGMALYRLGFFGGMLKRSKMVLWGWIGVIGGAAATLWIGLIAKASGFEYWASNSAFLSWSPLP
ncbi:MAG: DUF418 domain-containing protein, partial [Pseudomonadota bacterium]